MVSLWNTASLMGLFGVGLGAYGAHGLTKRVKDPHLLKSWSTASYYLMFHAAALMAISLHPKYSQRWSAPLIATGCTMFSGSIFGLVLLPKHFASIRRVLGPVTPLGGLTMMAGWATMLV
ncbi:DUF423 protein [Schizosaccharomyces japonicus yFS275]|uniref:DUF423 protein n=1 Tax=Schizosaccharomyces japonicus (strain yFS275 / FY16936) TaxID=402676 RepID=B6JUY6_SCHJY|nr:DUF423 protein [Schizosaccharomyces japonicus yFS275]EEB05090.1 DUF423 protein [Schizosaccharomyces japonicus yFS275]